MRRTLGSMGAWFLATSLAVLVSWLGVQSVRLAAVPDRVSPMSAAEARKMVPQTATPTPAPGPSTESPTPSASASPSASTAPSPSVTPSDDWTPVPDGRGGTALMRNIYVTGGFARLRFAANDVRVISTTPAQGFTASFAQQSPGVATVTFTSEKHTSRITAYWDRTARAQVSETPSQD